MYNLLDCILTHALRQLIGLLWPSPQFLWCSYYTNLLDCIVTHVPRWEIGLIWLFPAGIKAAFGWHCYYFALVSSVTSGVAITVMESQFFIEKNRQ